MTLTGVGCSGPPLHRQRLWSVADRRAAWREGEVAGVSAVPVPGAARVLVFDPFRLVALLDDGCTWRFSAGGQVWCSLEGPMRTNDSPAVIAAGGTCAGLWFATASRQLFTWSVAAGRAAVTQVAIPGEQRILAWDPQSRIVLVEGGARYMLRSGSWVPVGAMTSEVTLKVRCTSGVVLKGGALFSDGEVKELPEAAALGLIAQGRAELA
jgi:hypothetical protein